MDEKIFFFPGFSECQKKNVRGQVIIISLLTLYGKAINCIGFRNFVVHHCDQDVKRKILFRIVASDYDLFCISIFSFLLLSMMVFSSVYLGSTELGLKDHFSHILFASLGSMKT